ncbi:MAG: flippase-like domain-containing protein [Acaryochloridaceae cyanobacterium SU_2_1]|nr:flippase-like domain-containing protein [Acaryochloridaceae cyanobacterium SU_2_1]
MRISRWYSSKAFITGQFVGNLFMSQAGHAVKIALLRKERDQQGPKVDSADSTAIILADKIVDVGNLFLLTLLSALQVSVALPQVNWLEKGGIVLIGIPLLLLGSWASLRLLRRRSPRLRRWINHLQLSLRNISNPRQIRNGVAMDLGDWFTECLVLQILCMAQGYPLSLPQLIISLFVLNIGISAPISIANLGTFEASLALALKTMGIPFPQGIVIATVFHLLQIAGISVWMLVNSLNFWPDLPLAPVKSVTLDPLQNNCAIDKVASK